MSKFWSVVTLILAAGIGLLMVNVNGGQINFSDLETECRYDRDSQVNIDLNDDETLSFSGYYPAEKVDIKTGYGYSLSGNQVKLNVKSENADRPVSFVNNCLSSVIYDANTGPLDEGVYMVTVLHDGERAERKVIEVS